jgi:hypothetical protein
VINEMDWLGACDVSSSTALGKLVEFICTTIDPNGSIGTFD